MSIFKHKRLIVLTLLLPAAAALFFLGMWWNRQTPLSDFRSDVQHPGLRSPEVLYSWSGFAGQGGDADETLIGKLPCQGESCFPAGAILKDCTDLSPSCVPPWTVVDAVPSSLLAQPIGGYPPEHAQLVDGLLHNAATRCTGIMQHQLSQSTWAEFHLLCIDDTGLFLYRLSKV